MAKEENINININIEGKSVKELKQDFKDLKNQIAEASDPKDIERLSQAAGVVSDKIKDVNERIAVFAAGSDFEKVSNGLGLIGGQVASLDFEGAAESAKLLSSTIKGINPAQIASGLKGLGSTVLELGKSFVTMGVQLLLNPLFGIPVLIAAIVAAIVLLKDKIYIVGVAFDALVKPIKIVIQAFKDLTDKIGLTTFALEENSEKAEQNAKRVVDANNEKLAKLDKAFARELALRKARGEDTTQFEIQHQKDIQNITYNSFIETQKAIAAQQKIIDGKASKDAKAKAKEKLVELKKSLSDISDANKDAANNQKVVQETANTEERKKQKEHNDKLLAEQKAAKKKAEEARVAAIKKQREIDKKAGEEVHNALIEQQAKKEVKEKEAREKAIKDDREAFIKRLQGQAAYYTTRNALADAAEQKRKDDALKAVEDLAGQAGFSKTFELISTITKEGFELSAKNIKEIAHLTVDALQEVYSFASEQRIQSLNNELDTLEENKQKELDSVGNNEKAKADIEKKFAQQKFEIEKKIAAEKKRQAIINVLIDTAQAVVKTLAEYGATPIGIGLSVLAGALGAAQILAIQNASSSPKAPNVSGGGGGIANSLTSNATPVVNLTANSLNDRNANIAGSNQQVIQNNLTVKAVVSETDITGTQKLVSKVTENAKL